jgi:hypothetical protein
LHITDIGVDSNMLVMRRACSAHNIQATVKDVDAKVEEGEFSTSLSFRNANSNLPKVTAGKKYWPVLQMLRFYWLPGEVIGCCSCS